MMGGRRCGKTTALASLFEEMGSSKVNKYFTVADDTVLEIKNGEMQDSLIGKTLELKAFLGKASTKTFLADETPTNQFWDYYLKMQIPGTKKNVLMQFRDAPGEVFEAGGAHSVVTKEYIAECDVFVIVVDTPYLMGTEDENCKELCTEAINLGTNRINDIHGFLTNIDDKEGTDAKMVLFVPIKCEKWANEGRLDEVTARLKEVYAKTITSLSAYNRMTIGIIPIQTAGNILFSEFKEAYTVVSGVTKKMQRCCYLSDKTIRLEDGTPKMIKESDIINEDANAVIGGTNIVRPYSWYHINPQDSSFAPKNCEQLPLHILKFMIGKYQEFEASNKNKTFIEKLKDMFANIWKRLNGIFGEVKPSELNERLQKMEADGVLKYKGEGIEFIKRCY